MANDLWRWADPNGQQRSVRLEELRSSLAAGLLPPNTPVWKPGWKAWQPAHDVPELSGSAVSAANGVVLNIPPPPLAMLAVQQDFEKKAGESFSPPPMAVARGEEPPPPPSYVPAPVKSPSAAPPPGTALPPSLPTTIGLPPPPELAAMAAKAKAVVAAKHPPGAAAPDPMVEELSGSLLLDERSVAGGGLPPPTNPVVNEPAGTVDLEGEIDGLGARRNPLASIIRDVGEIRAGRPPKNKPKLVVAGVIGGALVLIFLAVFVSLVRACFGGSSDATTSASASATGPSSSAPPKPSASSVAPPAATSAAPPPPAASGPVLGDCSVTGEAKPLGWRAVVASGIEAAPASGGIALGFASGPRDGMALVIDPSTLATTSSARARAAGDVKRVTPATSAGKLVAMADVDRKGDKLANRRSVGTPTPIDIGVADGQLVWAPHGKDSWAPLFPLDGDTSIEALRGAPLAGDKGVIVAFRKAGAVWVGVAKGDAVLTPEGALARIPGLGQVGSPAIASSGDTVVVAWADRASAEASWQIRWTSFKAGGSPSEPKTLALPDGGLGGQAMSPSVFGLGGGRFLIAWTEGPVSNHQVRAITMGSDGLPSGSVLAISPQGTNAGQPQIGVGPDGRGVVAFLSSKGKGYELQATSITCAAR
jgi:hypothetical protein